MIAGMHQLCQAFYLEPLFWPLLLDAQPYSIGRTCVPADRAVFYADCDLFESRQCVIEELLVAFTEIALPCAAVVIPADPVFHAASPIN